MSRAFCFAKGKKMGLPSLLEDIVQKRIDNFLESAVDRGQFYTRDEFKRAVSQLGINARSLLQVDDEELVEISEEFARETHTLRAKNGRLEDELEHAQKKIAKLEEELESARKSADDRKIMIKQIKEDSAKATALCKRQKKVIASLEKEKVTLAASLSDCRDQISNLNRMVMQKLVDD